MYTVFFRSLRRLEWKKEANDPPCEFTLAFSTLSLLDFSLLFSREVRKNCQRFHSQYKYGAKVTITNDNELLFSFLLFTQKSRVQRPNGTVLVRPPRWHIVYKKLSFV